MLTSGTKRASLSVTGLVALPLLYFSACASQDGSPAGPGVPAFGGPVEPRGTSGAPVVDDEPMTGGSGAGEPTSGSSSSGDSASAEGAPAVSGGLSGGEPGPSAGEPEPEPEPAVEEPEPVAKEPVAEEPEPVVEQPVAKEPEPPVVVEPPIPLPNPDGVLRITDPVPGFASEAGGTTGGGTNLGAAVTVNSMGQLNDQASGGAPRIILVQPGNYTGSFQPGSNKTIVGLGPGVRINGQMTIRGQQNVIVRNIAIQGEPCDSYEACRAGDDGVYVGNDSHHVWLDHLDVSDGQDGNLDITRGADYVTISWTRFSYSTSDKEHQFSNLIAGSDDETDSRGKLKITYMNSWWADRVETRQPRGRFGDVHMLNNLHDSPDSRIIHGVGREMALIAENSVYNVSLESIFQDMGGGLRGWRGVGNVGTAGDLDGSVGSVFTVPYDYVPMPASQVEGALTSPRCGAGNTCTFQ